MVGDAGSFLLMMGFIFGVFAFCQLLVEIGAEEEEAEELAWVEREIDRTLNNEPVSPEAAERKREHLERLERVRERLQGL